MCSTQGFGRVLSKLSDNTASPCIKTTPQVREMWFECTCMSTIDTQFLFLFQMEMTFRWSYLLQSLCRTNTSWRSSIWTMSTTYLPTEFPAEPKKCDRYYTENNRTHFIYGGYEGIPENLLINFVVWVVSLLPTSKNKRHKTCFLLMTGSLFLLLCLRNENSYCFYQDSTV